VATLPPSDEQLRSTIATLRATAQQLLIQASTLVEKAAKLEDTLARRDQERTEFMGKPPEGPELDGNH
jgi:hypothetical protein